MICAHTSIKEDRPGQQDNCVKCGLDIIFTSTGKWVWTHSLNKKEIKALAIVKSVDEIHRERGLNPHG